MRNAMAMEFNDCELRARIGRELERLSTMLMSKVKTVPSDEAGTSQDVAQIQERIRVLGQLAAGIAVADPETITESGAGYGSTVSMTDLATGETEQYTLMVGSLVDIDAGQVSLASPIGQALLGRHAGDVVHIHTPQRERRLRIDAVVTIGQLLAA